MEGLVVAPPAQSWDELTWEQLCFIYSLDRGSMNDMRFKVLVFMELMGWEFVNESYAVMPDLDKGFRDSKDMDDAMVGLMKVAYGDYDVMVVVRDVRSRELYHFTVGMFAGWVSKYMKFLDSPEGFTSLPKEYIRMNGRRYLLPQPVLTNLTYQQFSAMQNIAKDIEDIAQVAKDEKNVKEIERLTVLMSEAKGKFLAHCLTPRKFVFTQNKNGELNLVFRYRYVYDSDTAWKIAEKMKGAPDVIFSICYNFYVGCVLKLKSMFPVLFSGGKGGKSDILVAELDSVNNIMKYQGYTSQQDVYDSNAVFILSILNAMTEEAKQIEKMRGKK